MQAIVVWVLRAIALVMIVNGVWMLLGAFNWFQHVPAALSDTGPPNGHLIRDVGLAYFIFGVTLLWSSLRLIDRRAAFLIATAFVAGHAADHAIEISLDMLPPSHWLIDLPLVLAPGLFLLVFALPTGWRWLTGNFNA
jgi:uncharacterized protein YjeT (DUF2065 family)